MNVISLRVSEQELFDLIMAVYAFGNNCKAADKEPEAARRHQTLLEKLHGAFESQKTATAR